MERLPLSLASLHKSSNEFFRSESRKRRIQEGLQQLNTHSEYLKNSSTNLRKGQLDGISNVTDALISGERVVYFVQPTSYGKTTVMFEIGDGFGGRQAFIAPSIDLTRQLMSEKIKRKPDADVGLVNGERKDVGHQFTFSTVQSLERLYERSKKGDLLAARYLNEITKADLVFADEVHRYLTEQRVTLLSTLFRNSIIIGATATDHYSESKNATLLFGKKAHETPIEQATREKAIADVRYFVVKTGYSLDDITMQTRSYGLDFNPVQLAHKLNTEYRDYLFLDAYNKLPRKSDGRRMPAVANCLPRGHLEDFTRRANTRGFRTAYIKGNMSSKECDSIYEHHKRGDIEIIAQVAKFYEGLNKPWVEVGLNLRPTCSEVHARQRLGRITRKSEESGKTYAYVIEGYDNNTKRTDKRPVFVPDLYGLSRFRNGDILESDVIQKEQKPKMGNATREKTRTNTLVDHTDLLSDIDIDAELIELPVLGGFKRSLVQYKNGETPENSKKEIVEQAQALVGRSGFSLTELTKLSPLAFEAMVFSHNGEEITGRQLVRAFINTTSAQYVTQAEYANFLRTLYGNHIVTKDDFTVPKDFHIDKVLQNHFSQFRAGKANAETTETVQSFLHEVVSKFLNQEANIQTRSILWVLSAEIVHPEFRGTMGTLLQRLFGSKNREAWDKFKTQVGLS